MVKPELFISSDWKDYELLDAGGGRRLERWGKYILDRPDPQALWPIQNPSLWRKADAVYNRSEKGGGAWDYKRNLPEEWHIRYKKLSFKIRPTGFKHTGLFPEQAYNWDRVMELISDAGRKIRLLNLFGYTGAVSVAAASVGAEVCHVDSAKGMLSWCKENAELSYVPAGRIRLMPEDCIKFVEREFRRGGRYDAIIMDPPSFGRGAKGEVWKLEDDLLPLLQATAKILTDNPLFFLINSYTAGISPLVSANMLAAVTGNSGKISFGELALPFQNSLLPCGISVFTQF